MKVKIEEARYCSLPLQTETLKSERCMVDNNRHCLMINSLMCDMVFVVYSYFVEKMDNFHCDLEMDVDSHENLLKLLMSWESSFL